MIILKKCSSYSAGKESGLRRLDGRIWKGREPTAGRGLESVRVLCLPLHFAPTQSYSPIAHG